MEASAPDIIRLFPTFVWKCRLEQACYEPLDRELMAHVDTLIRSSSGTLAGATWQSGHQQHKRPEFAVLIAHIERAARDVLAFLKVADTPFHITGCWVNVLDPGGTHATHSHPNNFLSGVYYLRSQAGADTINFHDPRPQTTVIRPPVTELTAYNTDQVVLPVSEGTLLLFPAWLPHSVSVNTSAQARVSVSFNIMFTDYDTTMSEPLWGH
ncbi:2OG-Fe(II) oxygenase family protein [Paraburkholderia sp. CNPSo 3281]|uniref:2OG-Fe(II) oxygenase family protein n=1 Tax=Paraburkholderia sp. CNPSo 3281 TaxID=2940933 RepID=UPI0020B80A6B|nr:2OG-Fe(II) oxygenase family protein [Paraburkholderia sp. CNPSo 3281]MCP3719945.1 2OG-Fe(II) oxygenase family protein [Paraburkholderia sp. CNPSo 3281]